MVVEASVEDKSPPVNFFFLTWKIVLQHVVFGGFTGVQNKIIEITTLLYYDYY